MRKYIIFIALLYSFGLFADELDLSNNVELMFEIENPSCTLEVNDVLFELGDELSYNQLKNSSINVTKNFNVQCEGIASASLSFSGANIDPAGNYLINTEGDDYASGVMIRLLNNNNEEYDLAHGNSINIPNGEKFSFAVTAAPGLIKGHIFTPGLIKSNVTIQLNYE
ncbi:fimbrial protein [Escherichia marmotae]|uniref:fimbrial protein n=1 Tax=Escherichia marmotae TaxID=1499973 RepID=UPI002000C708|nr:fimbrial protein [Escherichia marmotae]